MNPTSTPEAAGRAAGGRTAKAPALPLGRYRRAVASRALAAIGGGYALAAATAAGLGLMLAQAGMPRADAVLTATMLSFVVHAIAALWAFGCATTRRAWLGIVLPAVVLAGWAIWFRGALA
ncbi:MAG: DUF3649 domain-containing protein [Burkholderiaceae bacterium]